MSFSRRLPAMLAEDIQLKPLAATDRLVHGQHGCFSSGLSEEWKLMANLKKCILWARCLGLRRLFLMAPAYILFMLALFTGRAFAQTALTPISITEPHTDMRIETMNFKTVKWHSVAEFAAVEKQVTDAGQDEHRLLPLLRKCDEARLRDPTNVVALFGCGAALIPLGWNRAPDGSADEARKAQTFLLAALERNRDCYEIGRRLLFCSYYAENPEPIPASSRDPIVDLADSLVRFDGRDPKIRYALGLHFFYYGLGEQGAAVFERLVKEYPGKVSYHSLLADCYFDVALKKKGSQLKHWKRLEVEQIRICLKLIPKTDKDYQYFVITLKLALKMAK